MKAFTTLAVVVCLISFAWASLDKLSEEQKAKVLRQYAVCAKEENLSEEEVMKVHNKDYGNPSDNLKCFVTCFFEKTGILKDNVIQEEVAKTKLTGIFGEEKTNVVFERCNAIKGVDRCDMGHQIFDCFEKAKREFKNA